jgi:hypothetical protein
MVSHMKFLMKQYQHYVCHIILFFPTGVFLEMILYGHTHDYHDVFSYNFPLGFKEFYPDISMYI